MRKSISIGHCESEKNPLLTKVTEVTLRSNIFLRSSSVWFENVKRLHMYKENIKYKKN